MGFWDLFNTAKDAADTKPRLYHKFREVLPEVEEDTLIKLACYSGLLARIVHVDLKIEDSEVENFKEIIKRKFTLEEKAKDAIVDIALTEVQELIDIENQKYSGELAERLSEGEKMDLLKLLFEVSASDGVVENKESEEIRLVCKGLRLSDQHFLAARATIIDKLGALKG